MMRISDNKNEPKNPMYSERVKLWDKISGYEKKNPCTAFFKNYPVNNIKLEKKLS